MQLRSSISGYAFDAEVFARLRAEVDTGRLDPAANRLATAPEPLHRAPVDLTATRPPDRTHTLRDRGESALRAGKVAMLILNGGMATRFGGGAKGVVPVVPHSNRISFLAIKLAQVRQRAAELGSHIPAVVMHSFATQDPSQAHLTEISWSGLDSRDRDWFAQSIMPRVLPDGTPLQELPEAAALADDQLYAAPGHGDTLGRLRDSGVLSRLLARGVEHIVLSNVDNVGATLDPVVLGAHLEAVADGHAVSVEVVRRQEGDAGGCIGHVPGVEHPAIIEAFRLPEGSSLGDYPHFNTNTLWLSAAALDHSFDLTWFSVRKRIAWPASELTDASGKIEVVQFERLVGQITEFLPSAYLEVERNDRFIPIKTQADLADARPRLEHFAREAGLLD